MADGWSYFTFVAKVPQVYRLTESLNLLGAEGWELVTSLSTVKSIVNITGNELVLLFKKEGVGHVPTRETLTRLTGVDPTVDY